jgi:hypothetical protein
MLTSLINCARSQIGVLVAAGRVLVKTASVTVGRPGVLVGITGTVGGFRIATWVRLAATVWAATVKTESGPCVGVRVTLEGKLQAEIPNTRARRIETSRVVLDILFLLTIAQNSLGLMQFAKRYRK